MLVSEPTHPPSVPCPPNIYEDNVFFKTFKYIAAEDDPPAREVLHKDYFLPLNNFLKETNFDFIDGDAVGLKDASFAFFANMVNMMGLFFEGKSFISKDLTYLYAYLDRFMSSEAFQHSQGYEVVDPATIMFKFCERLRGYNMTVRPNKINISSMPLDSTHVYYELDDRLEIPTSIELPEPLAFLTTKYQKNEETLEDSLDAIGLKVFYPALSRNGISTLEQARTLDYEDLKDEEIGMNNFQIKRFKKMCSGQIIVTQVIPATPPLVALSTDRVVQKLPKSERRRRRGSEPATPKVRRSDLRSDELTKYFFVKSTSGADTSVHKFFAANTIFHATRSARHR